MKLTKAQTEAIEKLGFSVNISDEYITFEAYSPAGQDLVVELALDGAKKAGDLYPALLDYYTDYDPSYEAYIWLDDSGHGKNGAPYEMGDVYEDMCACQAMINELADLFGTFAK